MLALALLAAFSSCAASRPPGPSTIIHRVGMATHSLQVASLVGRLFRF